MVQHITATAAQLCRRAGALAVPGRRRILGLTGPPGAGKSTLAQAILDGLDARDAAQVALVPMDGFHLAGQVLSELGRAERKGAIDTFDAGGYLSLLRRLRAQDSVVYAPQFHRELEESIAAAIAVPPQVSLVLTEGNYLLVDVAPWPDIRGQLDEVWYIQLPAQERLARLEARHRRYGRSAEEAAMWARGSDQRNAELVEASKDRADLIVTVV